MEALQQAPISEMLLRRWGRTLAKYGITLEEMPEGKKELDQYLEMWGEARTPLVEKETGHTPSEP